MAKFCPNCGTGLPEAARFCANCGTPCPAAPQPQPQPIPQPAYPQQPAYQPQPIYPQQPMPQLTEKQVVLHYAPQALNRPEQPWVVTAEGDALVARWKWMDAAFFAPHEVSNEVREYAFTVTLGDNQTWRELDRTETKSAGVKMSGGKMSIGGSSSTFSGKTSQKSFQMGLGQNNQTGQAGLVTFKFDTTPVKESIRTYLKSRNWKKAGLFG